MVETIRDTVTGALRDRFGVEVVDLDIRRLSFPDQNRRSVFERMRAERERIARGYRSEGEEEAWNLLTPATSPTATAANTKRLAPAKVSMASAPRRRSCRCSSTVDEFTRTLQAYRTFLDDQTTLILPSDSELMRLLTDGLSEAKQGSANP